jgi:hypothetical protein
VEDLGVVRLFGELRERDVRGERREFFFMIIIRQRITTGEPYTLGSIIAFDGLRNHLGNLLWDIFCDFLDIFPTHRELILLWEVCWECSKIYTFFEISVVI